MLRRLLRPERPAQPTPRVSSRQSCIVRDSRDISGGRASSGTATPVRDRVRSVGTRLPIHSPVPSQSGQAQNRPTRSSTRAVRSLAVQDMSSSVMSRFPMIVRWESLGSNGFRASRCSVARLWGR